MNQDLYPIDQCYTDISSVIGQCEHSVQRAVNDAMVITSELQNNQELSLILLGVKRHVN